MAFEKSRYTKHEWEKLTNRFWNSCNLCTASAGFTPGTAGPWASKAFLNWITSTTNVLSCLSSSCSNDVLRSLTSVWPSSSANATKSTQFWRKLSTYKTATWNFRRIDFFIQSKAHINTGEPTKRFKFTIILTRFDWHFLLVSTQLWPVSSHMISTCHT